MHVADFAARLAEVTDGINSIQLKKENDDGPSNGIKIESDTGTGNFSGGEAAALAVKSEIKVEPKTEKED